MKTYWQIGMTLDDAERNVIEAAFRFYNFNKTMTAKALGVSLRGLDHKMDKFKINNPNSRKKADEGTEIRQEN